MLRRSNDNDFVRCTCYLPRANRTAGSTDQSADCSIYIAANADFPAAYANFPAAVSVRLHNTAYILWCWLLSALSSWLRLQRWRSVCYLDANLAANHFKCGSDHYATNHYCKYSDYSANNCSADNYAANRSADYAANCSADFPSNVQPTNYYWPNVPRQYIHWYNKYW